MDIKGRITHIVPLQTGEGKNGTWKKQDFVIETDGQYPKKVCFSIWGDKYNESFYFSLDYIVIFICCLVYAKE